MLAKIDSWNDDGKLISLGLSLSDIEKLILNLERLKNDNSKHFHLIAFTDSELDEITIHHISDNQESNMAISS